MGSSRTRKHNNIACQLKVVAGQGGLAVLSYLGTVFVPLYARPGRLTIRSLYAFILYSIVPLASSIYLVRIPIFVPERRRQCDIVGLRASLFVTTQHFIGT